MTGFRHVERGALPRFAGSFVVKTFPSGERRIQVPPPKEVLTKAFDELGTQTAVAAAFGVARQTVKHWAGLSDIHVTSRPEAGLRTLMRQRLASDLDKCKISQWLMDEGSVSVAYFAYGDYTILLVCGSMGDFDVLSSISSIVGTPITSSKAPSITTLPMGAIRVQSARAYALLETILPFLVGLKAKEAEAALSFFPPSGLLRGRHTTDEFLAGTWGEYARKNLLAWNMKRRVRFSEEKIGVIAKAWVEGRIRRARRFIDSKASNASVASG
jgi:hypothetical protein